MLIKLTISCLKIYKARLDVYSSVNHVGQVGPKIFLPEYFSVASILLEYTTKFRVIPSDLYMSMSTLNRINFFRTLNAVVASRSEDIQHFFQHLALFLQQK